MISNQQEIATPQDCKRKVKKQQLISGTTTVNDDTTVSNGRIVKDKRTSPSKTLVQLATLTAICIALKSISNILSAAVPFSLKISVSYVGWFLSAIIAGPIGGAAVALVSDILGQIIISTGGMPNPIIAAGTTLGTLAFGLCYKYLPIKNIPIKVVISTICFLPIATLGLNSLGTWLIYFDFYSKELGLTYLDYLIVKRFPQMIIAFLNTAITIALVPAANAINFQPISFRKKLRQETKAVTPTNITTEK